MDYRIWKVNDQCFFIKWYRTPAMGSDSQRLYLAEMQQYLDEASQPIYFLSDLQDGHIDDIPTLHTLGELAKHPQWGGGASFGTNRATTTMANLFKRIAHRADQEDGIFPTLDKALDYLEKQKSGLTSGIDWDALLAQANGTS